MTPTLPPPERTSSEAGMDPSRGRIVVEVATPADRERIARLRHDVYAGELAQHHINNEGRLGDSLDVFNEFLVAKVDGEIAGFISITPPGGPSLSIDKYFSRESLPFQVDKRLFEVRLLTVLKPVRGREFASLLMYAALRWVEAHGGTRVVAIGRREVTGLYRRVGLEPTALSTRSGAVTFDLMHASVPAIRARAEAAPAVLGRFEKRVDWRLPFPFRAPPSCFHGGAFFEAIGADFGRLERSTAVVNADVLDAWFPPAPGVIDSLNDYLPWLVRTSPPTACEGLVEAISSARGVAPANILPGAGSSDLIFRAMRHWLTPCSRVLLLDPTYGEYGHVIERVVGCTPERHPLFREDGYAVDVEALSRRLKEGFDLAVIVNPNSPTGRHVSRHALEGLLRAVPASVRVWVDETYVDYAGADQSLERFAAASSNVLVCKSMSKAYALSGMRVAYLCAAAHQLEPLRAITPPWVVGLPAQLAAVRALQDPEYYMRRYAETRAARSELAQDLQAMGLEVVPGVANFLMCHMPSDGPDAATVVARARVHDVFIRDASSMSPRLGSRCVRIAVKDPETNSRIVAALRSSLDMSTS